MACDDEQKRACLALVESFREIAKESREHIDSDIPHDIIFNGLMILFRTIDLAAAGHEDKEVAVTGGCAMHLRLQSATIISLIMENVDKLQGAPAPMAPTSRSVH